MNRYISYFRPVIYIVIFTLILGFVYPLIITMLSSVLFPVQSHGSLVFNSNGSVAGSKIIGINFTGPQYFVGRPSATNGGPYNASWSGGSNYGPTYLPLIAKIKDRTEFWRNLGIEGEIPSDLVMASGSGLDPDISLNAALLQVPLISKSRNISSVILESLVNVESNRQPAFFSGRYVNIFALNKALDNLSQEV